MFVSAFLKDMMFIMSMHLCLYWYLVTRVVNITMLVL